MQLNFCECAAGSSKGSCKHKIAIMKYYYFAEFAEFLFPLYFYRLDDLSFLHHTTESSAKSRFLMTLISALINTELKYIKILLSMSLRK